MPVVTDPAILAQLNASAPAPAPTSGPQKVTDPAILAQLNGTAAPTPDSSTPAFDAFKAGFDANYQKANPQPVDIANNPQASRLPGALGQLDNTLKASAAGIDQGATAGWGDEINAALMTPIEMIKNRSMDVPGQFSKVLADNQAQIAHQEALNPAAAHAGDVAGGLAVAGPARGPVAAAPSVAATVAAPTTTDLVVQGAKTGGAFGALNGAGRGNSLEDRTIGAVTGGVTGALTGAAAGKLAGDTIKPPAPDPAPSISDLLAVKNAAYKRVDDLGASYSPQAYDQMVNTLDANTKAAGINPDFSKHEGSVYTIQDLINKPPGFAPTMTQMDQIRQQVKEDAFQNPSDARYGKMIVSAIDDFMNNPANLAAGSDPAATSAILEARAANSTLRKTQTIQSMIDNAQLKAGVSGSGSNLNNNIRQQFAALLKVDDRGVSEAVKQGFSPDEIRQMANLALGGTKENSLRFMGNLMRPNPITSGPWALAIHAQPALGAIPAVGMGLKHLADTGTAAKAAAIADMVARRGQPAVAPQMITPGLSHLLNAAPFAVGSQAGSAVGQQVPKLLMPSTNVPFVPAPQMLPDGTYQ